MNCALRLLSASALTVCATYSPGGPLYLSQLQHAAEEPKKRALPAVSSEEHGESARSIGSFGSRVRAMH